MNKLVKGSIAGAAGIALLLGGAGTLALWNADAAIDDVDISSGTLTLSADDVSWTGPATAMIPGSVATYTSTLTINATGDSLEAELKLAAASITGDTDGSDAELASALKVELALTPTADVTLKSPGVYNVAANTGTITIPVTVTITLPSTVGDGVGNGDEAQGQAVDVTGLAFVLQQVA